MSHHLELQTLQCRASRPISPNCTGSLSHIGLYLFSCTLITRTVSETYSILALFPHGHWKLPPIQKYPQYERDELYLKIKFMNVLRGILGRWQNRWFLRSPPLTYTPGQQLYVMPTQMEKNNLKMGTTDLPQLMMYRAGHTEKGKRGQRCSWGPTLSLPPKSTSGKG